MMRRLATIRRIDAINPIEGADAIEVATVGGWKVVTKRGEYNAGDLAVYFEIDSWIPHELAPFLSNGKEPREFEGVKGERLRTIRLRGQISQGLLLPLSILSTVAEDCRSFVPPDYWENAAGIRVAHEEDADVTELFGILKYERPLPTQLAGLARGNFPSFIPKTDEERIQNLKKELDKWQNQDLEFEVTEKLDGSSMTVYITCAEDENGEQISKFGVCSRNLDLKDTEGNSFWEAAKKYDLESKMQMLYEKYDFNCAIQGELVGEGIQGNKYKLTGRDFYVFRMYHIGLGQYLDSETVKMWCEMLGLKQVPGLGYMKLDGQTIESLLEAVEGKSMLNPKTEREGIVFKCYTDNQPHFKAISNKFLIKNGE